MKAPDLHQHAIDGRPLSPEDPLAEPNLRPMLDATGWRLTTYDDAAEHFLARAVLAR